MPGRLVLITTTPRVPAGLLSGPAWQALHAADLVCARRGDPQVAHLRAAGVAVEELDPPTPREHAAMLLQAARHDASTVVQIGSPEGDIELQSALAEALHGLAEAGDAPDVELLAGAWDRPGSRLLDLVTVMNRLRSPGGCPWDAEQTHESLVKYLLEETYETVEVIETGDLVGLREELGDLLLQVVFHARIGEEHADEPWSIDDVAAGIVDKLVRRHPHVFGDVDAPTASHVEANWEQLKAAEKGRASAVDGVPLAQPALALAAKLVSRADRAGVDVPVSPPPAYGGDLGDSLFALAAAAVRQGLDPEAALRAAARRFASVARTVEADRARSTKA